MFTMNYAKIMNFVQEHKSITIDMCKVLFYNTKFGYDSSRRALNSLVKNKYLKTKYDFITDRKVYYIDKCLRSHDLLLLSLYVELISLGCEEVELRKEYTNKLWKGRSDGLIQYKWRNEYKVMFVEIDLQNKTNIKKYREIYNTGYMQEQLGTFPRLLIINQNGNKYKEKDKRIETIYINYKLENLKEIL